jgi:hypothetical protein
LKDFNVACNTLVLGYCIYDTNDIFRTVYAEGKAAVKAPTDSGAAIQDNRAERTAMVTTFSELCQL